MTHTTYKISFAILAFAILTMSMICPQDASAQYNQNNNKKSISVDKKVRSLSEDKFYDNMERTHKIFHNGDQVEFSIKIENTGAETLTQINAEDILPANLDLLFNPGTFNNSANAINWKIDELKPSESKTYLIRAKISGVASNSAEAKRTNVVEVQANGVNDKDTASYYIDKATIPQTGDSSLIIKTIAILTSITGAFALRKYARGY